MSLTRSQGEEQPGNISVMASEHSGSPRCQAATYAATLGQGEEGPSTEEAIALKKHRQSNRELLCENEDGTLDLERLLNREKKSKASEEFQPAQASRHLRVARKEGVVQSCRSQAARQPPQASGRSHIDVEY